MRSILFVCTGNIFRSMIAEHALRAQLPQDSDWRVSSAGTGANPMMMYDVVRVRLIELGIDPTDHVQRKLTQDILDGADLPVAMSLDHQAFVCEHFGREIPLYNRVCYDKDEPVLDLGESLPDWKADPAGADAYVLQMVDSIWESTPSFISRADHYLAI